MTYTVSSGTLNSSIPYHTMLYTIWCWAKKLQWTTVGRRKFLGVKATQGANFLHLLYTLTPNLGC